MSDKDQNGHSNGPQSPSRVTTPSAYDYNDSYDDYDTSEDQPQPPTSHHHHQQQQYQQQQHSPNVEIVQSVELPSPPATTTTTTTSTLAPSTTTPSTTAAPSTSQHQQQPLENIHLTTAKPVMVPAHQQQPPVTSMPLDNGNSHIHIPPVHENFVEGHRPMEFYNVNSNNVGHSSAHFPTNMYGRPGTVISVLPGSTSNVVVPHDQDTVSFVLGNRQNVEGSYYTHGTAMEEHPYAPNSNDNNFRPLYGSVSFQIILRVFYIN